MNIRIKIFMVSLLSVCVAVMIASYSRLFLYKSSVNESALSLCANIYRENISPEEKAKYVSYFLSFSDLPQAEREKMILAVKYDSAGTSKIIEKLEYFEYSRKNIKNLCDEINKLQPAKDTFSITKNMSSEELAEILLNDLFGTVSIFKTVNGAGTDFIKRYYCSNVCIDICKEGKIRYLCDISGEKGEDMFLKWLKKDREVIFEDVISYGKFICQEIESEGFRGKICIDGESGHVFAAEIKINSATE